MADQSAPDRALKKASAPGGNCRRGKDGWENGRGGHGWIQVGRRLQLADLAALPCIF
jgi:hypothetical protein